MKLLKFPDRSNGWESWAISIINEDGNPEDLFRCQFPAGSDGLTKIKSMTHAINMHVDMIRAGGVQ